MVEKLIKSDSEWVKILSPEQFLILRGKGTEEAFSGHLLNNKEKGTYSCIACTNFLFSSEAKFDSGTGWSSFFEPIAKEAIIIQPYKGEGLSGAEVLCSRCEGHLGHVFEDGIPPTGLRFCMNSAVLKFIKSED